MTDSGGPWRLALLDDLAAVCRALVAVPAALLPRRRWNSLPALPIWQASGLSGLATMVVGLFLGAHGLGAYLRRAADASIDATFEIAARQARGALPAGPDITTWDLQRLSVFSLVAFVLFTPTGLIAGYVSVSGALRGLASWFGEPHGDPLLTGLDALVVGSARRLRAHRARAARRRAEGAEVPDRLFTGEWAGIEDVEYVVVSSRRKPDWVRGTFVITSDGWFTLGDPFDLLLPQGLRTVYPLTAQKVTEVLRRGVAYELPPLGHGPRPAGR